MPFVDAEAHPGYGDTIKATLFYTGVFYTLLITEAFALVWIVGITISIYIAEQSDRDENDEQRYKIRVIVTGSGWHRLGRKKRQKNTRKQMGSRLVAPNPTES